MFSFSLDEILGSRVAELYGSSIFNFLRALHTVFHSGCNSLHSPSAVVHKCSIFFTWSLTLVICCLLAIAILSDVKWYLIVVLSFTSLLISDVEPIFMYLLAICMSFFERCQFRFSAHFFIGLFFCFILSCISSLYILNINLMGHIICKCLFHSADFLFILLLVFFSGQNLLSLIRSHLLIFAFVALAWGDRSKKNIAETDVEELTNFPLFFKCLFLFIYLAVLGLSCNTWDILVVACGI